MANMKCLIVYICLLVCALTETSNANYSKESKREDPYDTVKIVSGYNYPIKEYVVITADGYILKIQRIQCRNKHARNHNAVLIMNDFWASSLFWVMSGPKYSLAFYLADLGYDVWLGNNRGSKYGQDGTVIKPDDPAFWYYSFHEYGVYDLPAIVDFILAEVNCHKISYIGWGYGATQFFVMASVMPEYVKKFKNMQALAPSIYWTGMRSNLLLSLLDKDEESIYNVAGWGATITSESFLKFGGQNRCLKMAKDKTACHFIQSMALEEYDSEIYGYPDILNYPLIQGATRFLLHILQQIKSGFRYYDHGEASNLYLYGNKCPPKYNLRAADLPIAVYYSEADVITPSVKKFAKKLPKLIRVFKINDDKFGHNDFPLSHNGINLYFKWVKKVLEKYNNY